MEKALSGVKRVFVVTGHNPAMAEQQIGVMQAAERAGGFSLLAQMPEPQPAWAQQYDARMQPAWARKFEPPAISSSRATTAPTRPVAPATTSSRG